MYDTQLTGSVLKHWRREWALRAVEALDAARGCTSAKYDLLHEVACYACRDGASPVEDGPMPRWFGPRWKYMLELTCGGGQQCRSFFWMDHWGVTRVEIGGEQVRCFVSEPYWNFPPTAEQLAQPRRIAELTGCEIVVERLAWWHPLCIRLLFAPKMIHGVRSDRIRTRQWKRLMPPCTFGELSETYSKPVKTTGLRTPSRCKNTISTLLSD